MTAAKYLVSIVVPVFNEESSLQKVLRALENLADSRMTFEVIAVDDASTDRSLAILNQALADGVINKVLAHEVNLGKGAAIRSGFACASGNILVTQDADLEYDPREIPDLVAPIIDGYADAVFGSRFQSSRPHRVLYFWHRVGNGLLTLLSNMCTNLNLTDMETCYKALTIEVYRKIDLTENRFGIEPELTAKIAKLGVRVYEIGISYRGRTYAEGKKIGWRDGFRAIYCIIKYRFF